MVDVQKEDEGCQEITKGRLTMEGVRNKIRTVVKKKVRSKS